MDVKQHDAVVQEIYARWLDAATRLAFVVSLVTFLLYVCGALPPLIPLDALPKLWGLPVEEYLRRTGAPSGWQWLASLGRADFLSLASIALLPLVTLLCYLRLVPAFAALGERQQAAFALAQVIVLIAAMSGWWG
jgi:hypothetical protein